jgi:flagellar basal body-associated protein FliL
MAPHDTNTEKEARRHATPLIVMGVLLALVLVGFVWWIWHTFAVSDETGASQVGQPPVEQQAD